jgi:hypothetical protein
LARPDAIGLVVGAGEEVIVPLASAGTAGYAWTWDVTGDREAVEVTLQPVSVVQQRDPSGSTEGAPPDSGARPQQLLIRGRLPGEATIAARLARSFQPEHPPRAQLDIDVRVSEA